jgi:hypothetical protein
MTAKVFLDIPPDEAMPPSVSPFRPVFVAFADVIRQNPGEITVGNIVEAVASIALTAAINIRLQNAHNAECPDLVGLGQLLCGHIMQAVTEAGPDLAEQMGEGATKQ